MTMIYVPSDSDMMTMMYMPSVAKRDFFQLLGQRYNDVDIHTYLRFYHLLPIRLEWIRRGVGRSNINTATASFFF